MIEKNIITKEGLKELKDELKKLVEIERPQVIEEIKEARAQGDLSENAEFDAAREKQGQIEDRIKEIESIIENSTTIKSSSSNATVILGSKVEYQNMATNEKASVTIVGSLEADPFEKKISNNSPLGIALLNASKGEVVTVQAPKKYDVKITNIKN